MARRALINLSSSEYPKWKGGTVVYSDPLHHRFYYAILDDGEQLVNIHINQINFLKEEEPTNEQNTELQTKAESSSNAS